MNNLLHADITEKIIGCAFEVHNVLGGGFLEKVYQKAMIIELSNKQLHVAHEVETDIYYKNSPKPIGYCRADLLVNDVVLIELKANPELEEAHIAQTLNYMRVFKMSVGILICFGGKSVQFKRLVLNR
ncbi:MAG: GxxExxY protein [Chitinophagaceae bacterium]